MDADESRKSASNREGESRKAVFGPKSGPKLGDTSASLPERGVARTAPQTSRHARRRPRSRAPRIERGFHLGKMVEAAGIEPPSAARRMAAGTTCVPPPHSALCSVRRRPGSLSGAGSASDSADHWTQALTRMGPRSGRGGGRASTATCVSPPRTRPLRRHVLHPHPCRRSCHPGGRLPGRLFRVCIPAR